MKWTIFDWAGNLCFDGKGFSSFEDAESFLCEKLDDNYETDRQEYEITQSESRPANYLDPTDPRSATRKAGTA